MMYRARYCHGKPLEAVRPSVCLSDRLWRWGIVVTVWVKKSPLRFCYIFLNRLPRIFNQFLRTYRTFLSTVDYKFLWNYLQLWWNYAILSATTQRAFRPMADILSIWCELGGVVEDFSVRRFWHWTLTLTSQNLVVTFSTDHTWQISNFGLIRYFSRNHNERNGLTNQQTRVITISLGRDNYRAYRLP